MRTYRVPESAAEVEAMSYEDLLAVFRAATALLGEDLPGVRRAAARRLHALSRGPRGGTSLGQVVADLGSRPDGSPWTTPSRLWDITRHRSGGVYRGDRATAGEKEVSPDPLPRSA